MSAKEYTIADIFDAAKTNDSKKLLDILCNPEINYLRQLRQTLVGDLWALETALLHGNMEAANILAWYELSGGQVDSNTKPDNITISKSAWCDCLSSSVLRMKKMYRKKLRAPSDYVEHIFNHGSYHQLRAREWHPFYFVVRDYYSKILTPFEAIAHPAAFMALVRLDDKFRILSPEGYSLAMHIVMSRSINKQHKLAMLQFLEFFDEEVFQIPSGPEGLVPSVYCLKTNQVFLFERIPVLKDFSKFRFNDGKTIMNYYTNNKISMITANQRRKVYTETEGALNTFLIRNITSGSDTKYHDNQAIEAIETLFNNGKQDQLKEYADMIAATDDAVMGAYMLQIGYQFDSLKKFRNNLLALTSKKEYFKQDPQTSFDFINLPREMLELIMVELSARDVMSLFMVTKQMHRWFQSFDSALLWQNVLKNTKISLDGDIPMPTKDMKRYVLNTDRCRRNWQRGKFRERLLYSRPGESVRDYTLDDDWLCTVSYGPNTLRYTNLHTEQTFTLAPSGNPHSCILLFVISSPSHDRVVASKHLQVVDMNTQQVVAAPGFRISEAIPNAFNRSMTIANNDNEAMLLDKNMLVVQQLTLPGVRLIGMIDEFTLAVGAIKGINLYDTRKFEADNYQLLMECNSTRCVSLDARNQRMLVPVGPYQMSVQIDLKTRQWERVWKNFTTMYYNPYPRINGRYMVFLGSQVKVYDFNV